MTKPIIVVKTCYKLLYVIQVVKKSFDKLFLASTDIKVFGRTYLAICNAASDWPCTIFTPRVFLFSISLHSWKYKHMLLLASSIEVLHGHNLYLPSTQYCKLRTVQLDYNLKHACHLHACIL